jgi:hypothetical protein
VSGTVVAPSKPGCSGNDAQVVSNASVAALSHLNPTQNETNNIAPLNGNFARVFNPAAIFTQNWAAAFSSHASAKESPIIPGQSSFAVKLYADPNLGNTIAVVYPTSSLMHYLQFIPYSFGSNVNASNARAYLGCPGS